jgi:hypothetical protein
MIHLGPGEVCPFEDSCVHKVVLFDVPIIKCEGLSRDRQQDFVCNLDPEDPLPPENGRKVPKVPHADRM